METVVSVPIAAIPEIVAEVVGGDPSLDIGIDKDIHFEGIVWPSLIPDVAGDFGAGEFLDEFLMRGRRMRGEAA